MSIDSRVKASSPREPCPTRDEMRNVQRWTSASFGGSAKSAPGMAGSVAKPGIPFSFVYGGRASRDLLKAWPAEYSEQSIDASRKVRTITCADAATGLTVTCQATEYTGYPAVEWIVYFENKGTKDTPILENVLALDILVSAAASGNSTIHHARGSNAEYQDFAPLADTLVPDGRLSLDSHGGPPTCLSGPSGSPSVESLPFFNVEAGGRGVIAALGWSGPWVADFERRGNGEVSARARMDDLHAVLRPGERIRSPRVLLLFWQGDLFRAYNLWRRLMLAHYSPRPGGKPFTGLLCDSNWGSWMSGEMHIQEINWWKDHDLPMECYWMDAGWTDMSLGWVAHQSHQVADKTLFPNGVKPVSDAAHERGMKFVLWMTPWSVHPEVGIGKEHPEWLGKALPVREWKQEFYGLDHGDPKVNRYMIDYFTNIVDEHGVDIFRQDGTSIWPEDSGPDRQGISQVHYVEGSYEFWDGLLKKHPNLLIDNCAGGGRKIDIETMRLSAVFWRSDCQGAGDFDPVASQGCNYGLSSWVPLSGGSVPMARFNSYSFRSAYSPVLVICFPIVTPTSDLWKDRWAGVDLDLLRRLLKEYIAVRPYTFGDFYPLTPYSLDQKVWMAWQFDRPDLDEGMVQAFRRPESPDESAVFRLHGLRPGAVYTATDLDADESVKLTGQDLMAKGLRVTMKSQPGAAVVVYRTSGKS